MREITMMQLRKSPGLYIYWEVGHNKQSFILTHKGKPIAKIIPIKKERKNGTNKI